MLENLQYETRMRRTGASLIDSIVFMFISYIYECVYKYFIDVDFQNKSIIFLWAVFITGLGTWYNIYLHYKYGQTLGKMLFSIKVVNIDETRNITIKQAILRDIFYIILTILSFSYFTYQLSKVTILSLQLFEHADGFGIDNNFSNFLIIIWIAINIVSVFVNDKRRALHDFIADSVVIRSEYIQKKS